MGYMPVPACGCTGGVAFRIDFRIGMAAGAQHEKEEPSLEEGRG
jgi:hypothetical protein